MKKNPLIKLLFMLFFAGFILFQTACNKKCSSLQSSISGSVIGLYDFKECFIYAQFDSTLIIDSDTGFTNYKNQKFKNCNATLEAVDFSKNCILGLKVRSIACNAVFHRNITIDSAKKIYRYTVNVEKCAGCGTNITSTNIVLAPQIPAGYKVEFVSNGE